MSRRTITPTLSDYAIGRTIAPLWVSPAGRAFYPIAGGSQDLNPAPDPDPAPNPGDNPPAPKPDGDPKPADEGKTFTQADVERILAGRLSKYADYDDVKQQLTELQDATATEQEKAAQAAREEGRTAALAEIAPQLVRAEFKAAAKGRMEPAALESLVEDLDLTKYLTDEGEVDVERIEKKIDALAPPPAPNKPPLGGGPRTPAPTRAGSLSEAIANRIGNNR